MSPRLVLDVSVPCDRFTVRLHWETSERSLALFGPSGAGKTTILEAVAGLRPGAAGVIEVDGRTWLDSSRGLSLAPEERGVGYVPQDTLLFPHLDVLGNVRVGRRRAGSNGKHKSTERILELLELGPLARRPVTALSGGERQRVALARALCSGPGVLLLDEPLAGLDLPLRRRILPYLLRIREELSIPTLYVSHNASEVLLLAREVAVLAAGRMLALGRPQDVFTSPSILPMAHAEGFENVLRGKVLSLEGSSAVVEIDPELTVTVTGGGLSSGQQVAVGVRADDIIVGVQKPAGLSAQNILPGTVRELRRTPDGELEDGAIAVVVAVGRARIPIVTVVTPRAAGQLELAPGRQVYLVFKAQACRVLAAMGA